LPRGPENESTQPGPVEPGVGQVVLPSVAPVLAQSARVRHLYRLSDPALSELSLDALLDELLNRVQEALDVDTVAILLLDPETQELVARAAKGIEEEVEQGVRIPLGKGFAGRIAAERVAIYIAEVGHADILNPILREKGIRSLLGIPMVVEGQLIGVLHVGSLKPREFGQQDLAVLQLAAARAAPGIERARLLSALEHEHEVALVLQRSFLPRRLPEIHGVDAASRYIPARDEVGGDWYDMIELPRGLVGMVIGDVVGHGLRAAALMGQLRTALHSYAVEGHGPSRVLELVDRFVQSMGEYAMATAAYAVFDPETARVRLATAGHLPPIIVSGTGSRIIEVTPGAPLGGFPYGMCPEHELSLVNGEIMVMYTDGLVERRGVPLNAGLDQLAELIREATSAEDACRLAIDGMVPSEGPSDDLAVLAVQSIAVPTELLLELPADPSVLARVRRLMRRWLRDRGADAGAVTEITIAVNEACANAIEHAYPPRPATFELRARAVGDEVVIAIRDAGRWRQPRGEDRGRGLTIIEAAMDDIEVNPNADGTEIVMRRRLMRR
jgi:anti-sigma regulatory factor (Ser/Thr protein kinase)/putative methionine-R-sulfoxide reductase with GAF domain